MPRQITGPLILQTSRWMGVLSRLDVSREVGEPCSESPQKAGAVEREAILSILWSCGLGSFCNLENIKDVPNL